MRGESANRGARFANGECEVDGVAVDGSSIGTGLVPVLRDFQGSPMEFMQRGDEAGSNAGLAHFAGVPADDEYGHWTF